jgi:hypothetical protein
MPTFRQLELPEEVLNKIKERCKKQKSIFNIDVDCCSGSGEEGFNWSETPERYSFWQKILEDRTTEGIEEFFKKYPERIKTVKLISEKPRIYKANYKGKKYEIIIKEIKDEGYEN